MTDAERIARVELVRQRLEQANRPPNFFHGIDWADDRDATRFADFRLKMLRTIAAEVVLPAGTLSSTVV